MRSESEEAEGSGRHNRAGSGWGIHQRPACLRDRMRSPVGLLPTVEAPPSWKSLFSRVLRFSTGQPLLQQQPAVSPLPAAARGQPLFQQQPAAPGPAAQSILHSLHSVEESRHSLWGALHTFLLVVAPAAPCSGSEVRHEPCCSGLLGVQKRCERSSAQEQADTSVRDRKMVRRPHALRQPSSPEGSHAQALDPSACPDPSIRARPDQNAINRGRGQEARGRKVLAF